jgi:hypothetical protein
LDRVRIISSFRDYYDSATGHDDVAEPVYLRETRRVTLTAPGGRGGERHWQDLPDDPGVAEAARVLDPEIGELLGSRRYGVLEATTPVLLGFCGALARGWRVDDQTLWAVPALLDAVERRAVALHGSVGRDLKRDLRYEREERGGMMASLPDPFDVSARNPRLTSVFRLLGVPCFLVEPEDWWTRVTLVRDPPLEPLGFPRVLDPYSARQAVETFCGNELARQVDPMDDIPDEDLRDMKGFDDRSFRADPGGPGRKRKKGRER